MPSSHLRRRFGCVEGPAGVWLAAHHVRCSFGVLFSSCACVCRCRGCCSLSVCVCVCVCV